MFPKQTHRRFNPLLHLWAALLCFIAAIALHLNVEAYLPQASFDGNVASVQKNVEEALSRADRDIAVVGRKLLSDTVTFNSFLDLTYYPCFVLHNGRVVFWSDHTIVPDLYPERLLVRPYYEENKFGKFLVRNSRLPGNYTIYSYIPLEWQYGISNHYLSSGLNTEIFQNLRARLSGDPEEKASVSINDREGRFLFSVRLLELPRADRSGKAVLALLTLSIGFFISFLFVLSRRLMQRQAHVQGVLLFVLPLLLLRVLLLVTGFPFSITEIPAFDPKFYAASSWSPSIGDLLLNSILVAVIVWNLVYLFRKLKFEAVFPKTLQKRSWLLQLFYAFIFYVLLAVMYRFYFNLFSNSLLVMDITQNIEFSLTRVLFYLSIILRSGALVGLAYILIRLFYGSTPPALGLKLYITVGLLIIVLGVAAYLLEFPYVLLTTCFCIFWFVAFALWFIRGQNSMPYHTYLYVFLVLLISAALGSAALYRFYLTQLQVYKQQFSSNLLMEHDLLGEYLLEDIAEKIQRDALLHAKLMEPFIDDNFIKQKVSKYYLRDYFDKYETRVRIFDADGRLVGEPGTTLKLKEYADQVLPLAEKTEHADLYLIRERNTLASRRYVKFIRMQVSARHAAYILLELDLKKLMPYSVVPELLVDQKFSQPLQYMSVSYAVFQDHVLQATEGEFDYINQFNTRLLKQPELYEEGTASDNYHHFGVQSKDGRVIVITTQQYSFSDILSNFSFLFLIHALGLLLFVLIYLLFRRKFLQEFQTNFSTKIQLFLNFGILVPLVIVSIAIAGLVTASYKKDLTGSYEKRGKLIQENMMHLLKELRIRDDKTALTTLVNEVANLSEADINLYNERGWLQATSQPLIFEAGLLSKRINPHAFAAIADKHAPRVLLNEKAGTLTYNVLYLPLRNLDADASLNGFIGIPFYDSEKELNQKLIELFTTIMNIFTIMFILFMLLTFLAARALTVPLKLITEKLKKITLTGKNEVLEYESADEIGLLVNGYNQMLLKLEESKQELSMREKEAAWREMARQVAHEIKNPLTPMKLSLQYLQKVIAEKRPNTEELIRKISQTMITQIDILSDIATSFSSFTSMPEPKLERIDIAEMLKVAVNLHHDPAKVKMESQIPEEPVWVMADGSFMVRTFNNLLINALQAIPAGRFPEISVKLMRREQDALIMITDNGSGIPEDVHHKVFIPNFSTKYSGSGIGLAIAKKGIESAGGRIWFETAEDTGTTFYIELPLAQE